MEVNRDTRSRGAITATVDCWIVLDEPIVPELLDFDKVVGAEKD